MTVALRFPRPSLSVPRRWFLVPLALLGALFVPTLVIGAIDLAAPGYGLEWIIPFDWLDGLAYALAAFLWVGIGAGVAPSGRPGISAALFLVGAVLAQLALEQWYFPENHPRAYTPSSVPLTLALVGGAIGVATVWWAERSGRPRGN